MRRDKLFILMSCILLIVAFNSFGKNNESDDLTILLMKRARANDVEGLLELRDRAMSSPATRYAYHLARYIADPTGYAENYVAAFPATAEGIMGYVFSLEMGQDGKQLTPYFLYSFDQLGKLAIAGNSLAAKKLFEIVPYSDAVVTDFICGQITQIIETQATTALEVLAKFSSDKRKSVYICFGTASVDEIINMKNSLKKQLNGPYNSISKELINAIENAY